MIYTALIMIYFNHIVNKTKIRRIKPIIISAFSIFFNAFILTNLFSWCKSDFAKPLSFKHEFSISRTKNVLSSSITDKYDIISIGPYTSCMAVHNDYIEEIHLIYFHIIIKNKYTKKYLANRKALIMLFQKYYDDICQWYEADLWKNMGKLYEEKIGEQIKIKYPIEAIFFSIYHIDINGDSKPYVCIDHEGTIIHGKCIKDKIIK